jgi:cytochrome c oxidase subunit 2
VGPTWKGLFGKTENLTDGSTVVVDEAYLRESILTPNAKVAQGFLPGTMAQDFGDRLSELEIKAIIEYIKTLR